VRACTEPEGAHQRFRRLHHRLGQAGAIQRDCVATARRHDQPCAATGPTTTSPTIDVVGDCGGNSRLSVCVGFCRGRGRFISPPLQTGHFSEGGPDPSSAAGGEGGGPGETEALLTALTAGTAFAGAIDFSKRLKLGSPGEMVGQEIKVAKQMIAQGLDFCGAAAGSS
jgi:hypothetical protein